MNKQTIIRLIQNKNVSDEDFIQFILDYIEFKKKPTPTPEQIQKLLIVFQMGYFNLINALREMILHLKLTVIYVYSKEGALLRTDVYD